MFTVEEIQDLNELELSVYEYVRQHKRSPLCENPGAGSGSPCLRHNGNR